MGLGGGPDGDTPWSITRHGMNISGYLTNYLSSYLFQFNKTQSSLCVYEHTSTSLYYILNYPLISTFHINKSSNAELSHWFPYIVKINDLIDKIINFIK